MCRSSWTVRGGFSTVKEDATVGWSRSLPEGCGAGATNSLFTWDPTAPCVCPAEEDLATFPTRADDCRLRDEDADQRPGYTVKVTYSIPVLGNVVVDVSQVLALRGYFQGLVDDTGPHDMRWLDTGSQLAALHCEISGNETVCLDSQVTYCTGDVNQMVLIPLPGELKDWNCERLMTAHDSLICQPVGSSRAYVSNVRSQARAEARASVAHHDLPAALPNARRPAVSAWVRVVLPRAHDFPPALRARVEPSLAASHRAILCRTGLR